MQNNSISPSYQEISLLDILVVLFENIKLLIISPIFVVAAAYGISSLLPSTYESTAWLVRPSSPNVEKSVLSQALQMTSYLASQDTLRNFLRSIEGVKWGAGRDEKKPCRTSRGN